jgi:diphthine synthase
MLYIIGLGLDVEGISQEGSKIVKRCKKVYLENYTAEFPYTFEMIEDKLQKKIISANREKVESLDIVDEAKRMDVALLVYGSPLTATTHISLIQEAKRIGVRYRIIYSASILDAVAETGLQLYKFGKIASMPKWDKDKNFSPDSFMEIIKENQSVGAHSLILIDIGLSFEDAAKQLAASAENHKFSLKKVVVCERVGTEKKRIFYMPLEEILDKGINIKAPFSIIIPSKLHFVEKEMLDSF